MYLHSTPYSTTLFLLGIGKGSLLQTMVRLPPMSRRIRHRPQITKNARISDGLQAMQKSIPQGFKVRSDV